ncbi:MAG: RimK family alpha-L-glutamate ligase [Oscillospiraceae bacterium]|nr:RimK family alpha-L-glutamate ligase [Oscillospiraceae bacterium]
MKLRGWLICNGFLTGAKFSEHTRMLMRSAEKNGIDMTCLSNADVIYSVSEDGIKFFVPLPDFVLFWDKDVRLAYALESAGIRCFNSAKTIELCDDKALSYEIFAKAGIKIPKTFFAPLTFENVGYQSEDYFRFAGEQLGYPLVLKERFGSFGKQVYLINSPEELFEKVRERAPRPMLMQELIKTSYGKDLRVNIVGGEVVATMLRTAPPNDFRANVTAGGKMELYEPTEEEKNIAIACSEAVGADFSGVDLMFGEDGPVVCEINSNAYIKNITALTGVNIADKIFEHIKRSILP